MMSQLKILIASNNAGKITEIKHRLSGLSVEIKSLQDFPHCPDADEPFETYVENARQKAQLAAEHSGLWALADDSGLEVELLNGAPGVKSARYAGDAATYADNCQKLLEALQGVPKDKRSACFKCCMVLRSPQGEEFVTEGELFGVIAEASRGNQGFGYDPVFEIPEIGKTLAELSLAEKNGISHRTKALEKMKEVLRQLTHNVTQ